MALFNQYSDGPKSKAEPHIHRNPWIAFLMINMASGIAREHTQDNVAQHGGLVQLINWPKQRTSFDIGKPCYDQLTPIKSRHLLISITFVLMEIKCDWQPGTGFSNGLRAQARLTLIRAGLFGSRLSPSAYVLSSLRLFKFRSPNIINRKPPLQLQGVSLVGLWITRSRS